MSEELYAAKPGPISPIAHIGQNILIYRLKHYELMRVLYREGIPASAPMMRDFGTIAPGITLAGQSMQAQLEMPEGQLGQFRIQCLDDIQVTIWQPRSVGLHQVKNTIAQVTAFTSIYDQDAHTTEFNVFEDTWPYFDITNPRRVATGLTSRVVMWGFKYALERIGIEDEIDKISLPYEAVVSEGY